MKVTIYSRPGCHLCDEAVEVVNAMAEGHGGIEVEIVDIESDDRLMLAYLERIPVVEAGGVVVSELTFDPAPLRAALGIA